MLRRILPILTIMTVLIAASPRTAIASQIGIGDFSSSETVTTFNSLGLPFLNAIPIVFDGNSYTTSDELRYIGFSRLSDCDAECIGSDTDLGYIDIVLGAPATHVGALVGMGSSWTALVEFFDTTDTLLGTINYALFSSEMKFAGWEDSGGISRFRVTDTASNGIIINLDDFRFESAVPEPTTALLLACGLVGLGVRRRLH
jgi:hypothetical protein